ncbi:MAG: hypothetical protein KGN76_15760 [Acidobacteriota bacterium]|nr:hypothetical protein [Acidobacteriota bacterium]
MTTLVRSRARDDDDLEALRARVAEVEAALHERGAEASRMKSDLDAFRIKYRHRVGLLHERLDELDLAITEAELGEISKRLEGEADRASQPAADPQPAPAPQYTSDAVRKLFRDVAKAIHPDLARDEAARDRRHTLMVEANRAYALGDEEQLRWILESWERSPDAVQGSDPGAIRLRLSRRIEQIEDQLERLAGETAALQASALWRLKTMVDEAAAKGKDLIGEMVARLERDIMVATNRLEAIRPPQ